MKQEELVSSLIKWKELILTDSEERKEIIERAYQHNKWFTPENIMLALDNICSYFLDEEALRSWIAKYPSTFFSQKPRTIGMIMAGNIPLAGFHDLLCVLITGNHALIKLSTKDNILLPWLIKELVLINEKFKDSVIFSEHLKDIDAVIATGGENAGRYFDYYFGKYPHLFRSNRGSVAILDGTESKEDFEKMGMDIYSYFGLGCRNVSKLLLPAGYELKNIFEGLSSFSYIKDHSRYKNNFDYGRTILLMNHAIHLHDDFMILEEKKEVVSPVAILHYEYYNGENELKAILLRDAEQLQCVVGKSFIPFGKTQSPALDDYADGMDTIKWLMELN